MTLNTKNHSPWLHQVKHLHPARSTEQVKSHVDTDLVIVGGGIAGISTAYFLLKQTDQKVCLVEGYKVAHGATGHNAGQVVSYFERPFTQLAMHYGLDLATKAQEEINQAWDLLEEMYTEQHIQIPLHQFTGYAGCMNFEQLLLHLQNKYMRAHAGFVGNRALIADDYTDIRQLPKEYEKVYTVVPKSYILNLLESKDERYIAALPSRKGCLNSAAFCEELVTSLQKNYPTRFTLFEHTPINRVILAADQVSLESENRKKITAKKVVLCTNGFETLELINTAGTDIDRLFHERVQGVIGYMAGYLEPLEHPPTAISYLTAPEASGKEPYFYLTRRMYELEKNKHHSLICIGGPEKELPEKDHYDKTRDFPEKALTAIDEFLQASYRYPPRDGYAFQWHGLMGYTNTGVRLIGPEPRNRNLLYNLGCNGVGILPSIYGGNRIARFIQRGKLAPSIFDPRE